MPRASAQRPGSASLTGAVTDPTGALVPGADVRLSGVGGSLGRTSSGQTDRGGRFSLQVPPGTYTFEVQSEGFAPFCRKSLLLAPGRALRLPVQLAVAGREEQIDVDSMRGQSTDPGDNGSALVFSGDKLNMLSDDPATLQQQIQALMGPGLGGQTQILVNGFTGGHIPPKAAIRSISVNSNPYSAYYDTVGFGRAEIDTKPGGDRLHGQIGFTGTDQPLDARNPFTTAQPPFYQFQSDGDLTGPVGKKTAYFLAENIQQLANTAAVNAVVLAPSLTPGAFSEAVAAPQLAQTYSLRLDRQFNPSNFGFLRNEWSQTHTANDGLNPLVLPSAAYASNTLTNTLQASATQLLGPHAVNEVRFQYLRTRTSQIPNSTATGLLVEGAAQEFGSPTQFLHDNGDHYELQDRYEFDRGTHAVRAGFRFRALREGNSSTANFNGQYVFTDIASYQLTEANLLACALPGNPACLSAAALRAAGGGAAQFSLTTGQPSAALRTDDVGVYAEDDWRLRRNVTLSYGLRFESQSAVPDHADPAPRLGLAWAVHRGKRPAPLVTLRLGYGIFYNRFPAGNLLTAVRQNGTLDIAYFEQNPDGFAQNPDGSPIAPPLAQLAATEPTIYRVNPALHTAMLQAGSLSADRYLGRRGTVSATLLYGHGAHEYLTRNINAPLPGTFNPGVPNSGTRPLGTAGNIYQFSSDGNENDVTFSTNTQLQLTPRVFVFASYTLERDLNESNGIASFPSNQYDLRADYGRDGTVHKQTLNSAIFWRLPQAATAAVFFNAHSGAPFDITTGTDLNGDTLFNDRPALATDLSRPSVVRTAFGNFDTAPAPGQATIPRNYGDSPALLWVDLQLRKSFHVGPRPGSRAAAASPSSPGRSGTATARPERPWEWRFQVDAQNVMNHTNPGLPIGVLPTPGQPLCNSLLTTTGCSYFGRSLSLARDFSPLTASNRTILLQTSFSF